MLFMAQCVYLGFTVCMYVCVEKWVGVVASRRLKETVRFVHIHTSGCCWSDRIMELAGILVKCEKLEGQYSNR